MTRLVFAMAVLACAMFAFVPVAGQGSWIKSSLPTQGRWRLGGVVIDTFGGGFRFDPLPNGAVASLSPSLDQPAVVVFLTGPPSFDTSKTEVWILRRDATVAPLRTRWREVISGQDSPDRSIHYFVFDGAPISDVAGITVSIDGQLHVRSLPAK